jgi:Fe-S-cluster containining protein
MKKEELFSTEKIECKGCLKGINMCELRPCWGTVKDFKKIINAGFSKKLMIDYYESDALKNKKRIYFLSGASNGNECSKADWNPRGECSFLENELCSIYNIRPTIGAIACCKKDPLMIRKKTEQCIATWDTKEGELLIEKWKKLVEYQEKEDDAGFSLTDGLNAMVFGF